MARDIVVAWDDFLAMADVPPSLDANTWQATYPTSTHFLAFFIHIKIQDLGSVGYVNLQIGAVMLPWPYWSCDRLRQYLEYAYPSHQFYVEIW